jgi:hypothetical protein
MTLFCKALVKCARQDFVGIWKAENTYTLMCTNNAADFNELVNPGDLCARIIFGTLHLGELDKATLEECKYQARRYNESISNN